MRWQHLTGGQIVGGTGSISQTGLTTTINQNTNSLAINWNSFDVNSNETVNFNQPDASSIALNQTPFEPYWVCSNLIQ